MAICYSISNLLYSYRPISLIIKLQDMEYTVSNIINKPIDEVVRHFKDEDGVKHWMEGLQKITRISGDPHTVGAKSEFLFVHKGKEMLIKETILEEELPHQIKFEYESPMGKNQVEMKFESMPDGSTKQSNTSYFEMKGLAKIFGFLAKGMFKKQSLKYMNAFKKYVEKK